ncbi:DUF1592 domain-containing protein [Verrucomicrobiota bacterium sgz303538]
MLLARAAFAAGSEHVPDTQGFAKTVQPFLQEHCVSCHGVKKQKGDLRLDTLKNDFLDPGTAKKWANVVNTVSGHEMPPEEEKQPSPDSAGRLVEWLTAELGRAEIAKRSGTTVMRRMNRAEYNNTIRDLVGVDFQPAEKFPEDPPAGGFDNVGEALTVSPLHLELYYAAAQQILSRALYEGAQPPVLKWHFEPEDHNDKSDGARVKRDGQTITLSDGINETENGFTVVHHSGWNTVVGFRNFKLPYEGEYIIRFRAAGRLPMRPQVVESARVVLGMRRDQEVAKGSSRKYQDEQFNHDLEHFETHRMYDYGPPRLKISTNLGGTPKVVTEMDVDAPESAPKVYEVRTHFTKQIGAVALEYAYDVPSVLQRDWLVRKEFAVPLLLIDWIEIEGPIYPTWPPASHTQVLGATPIPVVAAEEKQRAREVLTKFMTRAFRRPVTAEEVDTRVAMFEKVRALKPSVIEAIKVPLASVLTSPNFLYLIEPQAEDAKQRKLTPYEFASRLSYFLWSSMPDDELFRLAASGELAKPEVRAKQVSRMLGDPKSAAFVTNFAGQWLGLRKVGANPPVKNRYPEYDRHLELSIVRESEAFFAEILRHDLDVRNFIKSDFVTINERLARFYGISGVKGDEFRRVPAPPESHRGGVLTQASIHSITSNGTRTLPVARGVWVLKTMLGTDPGLPVANAGEIATKVPGIDKATVRQRLQIHREDPSCARCHDKIDPLGFALENFNAAGEWRDKEAQSWNGRSEANDPVIDASARMPDGSEFKGVEGLQTQLLKQEELFFNGLATKLFTYALGRELGFSDRPRVAAAVDEMKRKRYTLRSLLQAIVASEPFSTK